ncbi:UNKNOWN [Stylonychia lemnae]|uniref:Polycystin domain-containing protein n=1 Tax=Stylonychia lemnae TaxID=5949 RepID=A0A078ASY7_STYLE|nr:UNKNOWN [Stylonychia lemnae]|eukprot:CDW84322.1 UNKNOWN [Stylonychia lemnae]
MRLSNFYNLITLIKQRKQKPYLYLYLLLISQVKRQELQLEVKSKRVILEELLSKQQKLTAAEEALSIREQKNIAEQEQQMREKTQKIEEIVYKKLKFHLKQKLENFKKNPQEILLRHQYVEKESGGRPYVNAVQIKILSKIAQENPKEKDERAFKQNDPNQNLIMEENQFFTQTFRISKQTDMNLLKKLACDFWGLNEKHYQFYDENTKPVQSDEGNQVLTADKYFETSGAKSSGSGSKLAVLYIGKLKNDPFLVRAIKGIQEKKSQKNINDKEDENGNRDEFSENNQDMEEEFLQNFAGLQAQYNHQKNPKGKRANQIDTKCCTLFILTLLSIQLKRDVTACYWAAGVLHENFDERTALFTNSNLNNFYSQDNLFVSGTEIVKHSVIIGAIQFKQSRVVQIACPRQAQLKNQYKCYENYYTKDTMETKDLNQSSSDQSTSWFYFQDSDNSDYSSTEIKGSLGTYDSQGYIIRFPPYNTTLKQYQNTITQMKKDQYLDLSTIALGLQAVDALRIVLLVYIIYIIIIKLADFSLTPDKFMTNETNKEYFYTLSMAYWFYQSFIIDSICLLFILYKMIQVFRTYRTIEIILQSIETASLLVGALVSFICVVLIGMSIVAMNIWGAQVLQFKTFSNAFLSVIFLQMGILKLINNGILGLVDFDQLQSYSIIWSFLFIILYCIFIIYILLSSFMIIFIDSYRRIVIQEGSLTQDVVKQGETRTFSGFLKWFFGWLPDECLKKIGKNDDNNDSLMNDEDDDVVQENNKGNDSDESNSDDDKS